MDGSEFALCIHHGGKFITVGAARLYSGGIFEQKFGFDSDKFGYFDLKDEVEKLGYESWRCLAYKVPKSLAFMDLCDDKDIMLMLKHLSQRCSSISVYVDDGKKKGAVDSTRTKKCSIISEIPLNIGGDPEHDEDSELGSDDGNDYDIFDEDDMVETDDSLDDDELGSDDDEYKEARKNIREEELVVPEIVDEDNIVENVVQYEVHNEVQNVLLLNEPCEEAFSDYVDSDGYMDSDSTDEDGEFVRKKIVRYIYDPKCDHKKLNLQLGMRFADGFQCKEAIRLWAIYEGHPIRFRRVSKTQLQARCTLPCIWRCYGSIIKAEKSFAIKTLVGKHTCTFDIHNKLADYKWIAKQYLNVFRMRPHFNIVDLEIDINDKFAIQPSRARLYRARSKALQLLRGSVKQHYHKLRSYIAELVRVDRDGRFELLLDASVFKGLYIGFSALKKGFMKGCRWIIGLDGCFLKTHLGGQLLCAIAKDGNNQMYPIAWAVVEVENEECWKWFLQILLQELGIRDGNGVPFISDQQKGLQNAVRDLAPCAEHRNCARHVYCNWKKQFKGETLKNMFWAAVRSTYQAQWKMAVEEIKAENPAAYDNFMERDPVRFCKAFISTSCTSDMVDNNISETFNGYIVKARAKHIIHMLEDIRSALRERQYNKVAAIKDVKDKLCPNIRKKLEKLRYDSRHCQPKAGLDEKFEVLHHDDRFSVSLLNRTCTCRVWDITGIPCVHALAAIHCMKRDPADYVHHYYTVETYLKAYSYGLEPINGEKMWPNAFGYPVEPPKVRKMPGRPKKNKRRKEQDERDPKNPTRLRRIGIQMTCQKCLQPGHNSRGCKNEEVQKPPSKGNGKRGRPKKSSTAATEAQNPGKVTAKVIAKERVQARKGYGRLVCEETGNTYLHMSSSSNLHFVPPRSSQRRHSSVGTSTNSGTTCTKIPTQESHAN